MNYSRVRWAHSEFPGNSVRCEFHPREIYFIASIRLPPPPSTRSSAIVFIVASRKRVTRLRNIGRNTWPRIKPSGRKIDVRKIRAALECELVAGTFSEPAAFFFSFFRISIFDLLPLHCRCRRNRGRLPNPSPDSSPLLAKIISTYLLAGGITFIGTCWRFHPSDGACRCWLNPARLLPAAEGAFLCRTGLASPTVPILRRRARECFEKRATASYEIAFRQISRGRILLLRAWEEWKGKIRDEFNFVIRNKSFLSHFLSFADLWILNSGFCFAWFVAPSVKQRSFVFEKRFQSLKIVKRFGREELYFIERAEKG